MQNLIDNHSVSAGLSAVLAMTVGLLAFMALEPATALGTSTDSNTFEVTQEIGAEVSFTAQPNDVVMRTAGGGLSIGAVTGGQSYGTSSVRVYTNNTSGYTLGILFASTTAMELNGGGGHIDNYSTTSPDFNGPSAGTDEAFFAFTASSSNLTSAYNYTGSACGSGSSFSTSTCWFMESDATNLEVFLNNSGATAAGGELTDLAFTVSIGANNTDLPNGVYTATATLRATLQ